MSKTLQQIKDEVRSEGIKNDWVDQIAIRYAQEVNKDLVDMLTECASVLTWTLENAKPDSDWQTFFNSITNAMVASEELIIKHKGGK